MDDKFCQTASQYMSGESTGAKLETVPAPSEEMGGIVLKKPTMIELDFVNEEWRVLGLHMDLAIVKLICVAALLPHIADYQEWKDLFTIANKAYHLKSSSIIANSHIPMEAVHVQELVINFLKLNFNMMVSFDGGGMKRQ
ncbi:hypothetical protein EDD22DRAFT_960106 [Suillus occidentalis]|nr:hypothetical protein EDD22DRAFT_960106 [Suillus occidentalis]